MHRHATCRPVFVATPDLLVKQFQAELPFMKPEEGLEDGTIALVIICLILIFLTILAIAFHYCNFKGNEKYEKLERENELVEVDLYESDN